MFTGPVGPVEVFFYWPEAVFFWNFYWPGAIGSPLVSSPGKYHEDFPVIVENQPQRDGDDKVLNLLL